MSRTFDPIIRDGRYEPIASPVNAPSCTRARWRNALGYIAIGFLLAALVLDLLGKAPL